MESAVAPERRHQPDSTELMMENTAAPDCASLAPPRIDREDTDPEILSRLEWLDDLMFAAINGDPISLQTAADAWHQVVQELGTDVLEESRRQYLRHAQSVWHELRSTPNHPPHKVFAAIEIISLLAGRAW
jgi:hypothetical protein